MGFVVAFYLARIVVTGIESVVKGRKQGKKKKAVALKAVSEALAELRRQKLFHDKGDLVPLADDVIEEAVSVMNDNPLVTGRGMAPVPVTVNLYFRQVVEKGDEPLNLGIDIQPSDRYKPQPKVK